MFICIIDAYLKWIFIKHEKYNDNIINKSIEGIFFSIGIPTKLVTDNEPSLCSTEMKEFLKINRVFHI